MIIVLPALIAVTRPTLLIVAIAELEDSQGFVAAGILPELVKEDVEPTHAFGVPDILHCAQLADVTAKSSTSTDSIRRKIIRFEC